MKGEIKVTELNQMITETQNKIDWYSVELKKAYMALDMYNSELENHIKQIDTDYETAN